MVIPQEIEVIGMDEDRRHVLENGHHATKRVVIDDVRTHEDGDVTECPLVYKISDRPPIHLIIFFGFQVDIVLVFYIRLPMLIKHFSMFYRLRLYIIRCLKFSISGLVHVARTFSL